MRVAKIGKYNGNIEITEQDEKPLLPNEIRVRIQFASVTPADCQIYTGKKLLVRAYAGMFKPVRFPVLGGEFVGTVEEVGINVTKFDVGQRVFGFSESFGAHAELLCINESACVAQLPNSIDTLNAAGATFGLLSAQYFIKHLGNIQARQHILINGASGAVGLAAIQLAKANGCKVTAVCSKRNQALVKSFGADICVPYDMLDIYSLSDCYDIVLDAFGNLEFNRIKSSIRPSGCFVTTAFSLKGLATQLLTKNKPVRFLQGFAPFTQNALNESIDYIVSNRFKTHIESVYSLHDLDIAIEHVLSNRKLGSVLVSLDTTSQP